MNKNRFNFQTKQFKSSEKQWSEDCDAHIKKINQTITKFYNKVHQLPEQSQAAKTYRAYIDDLIKQKKQLSAVLSQWP